MKTKIFRRRILIGLNGHPGTSWMLFFTACGFLAGWDNGLLTAITGAGIMLIFFGPMYLWGAYSHGKANE